MSKLISIVTPTYNEEESIKPLINQLIDLQKKIPERICRKKQGKTQKKYERMANKKPSTCKQVSKRKKQKNPFES